MDDSEKHAHANDTNLESISTDSEQLAVVVGDVTPKVHFSLFQTLGMAFSITGAPLAIGLYLSLVIGVGGSPFYIWGFGFVVFFQMIVCVAVAEIASAIPHSSGKCASQRRCSYMKAHILSERSGLLGTAPFTDEVF
jgi:hypothetical protein